MASVDESKKKQKDSKGESHKDNPLLRTKEAMKDKVIGNEDKSLAARRLAAVKRARDMSSLESQKSSEDLSSSSSNSFADPSPPDTGNWIQLGPNSHPGGQTYSEVRVEVSGRITSIVIDPNDSNTIYVGAAQGGIWKTTNAGKNWVPTCDSAFSLAIGALTIDKTNPLTLYAGTGEANFSGDSQYGLGVIKSVDGGSTWEAKGIDETSIINAPSGMIGFLNSRFSRLAISPKNSSLIFAATIASNSPNVASGLYRSNDGGERWARLENGLPPLSTIGATDIVLDPSNQDIAYCAFFGKGIYKTTNLTSSNPKWNRLSGGLPEDNFTRIVLAISESSPKVLYALIANGERIIDKFLRSSDGGNSWESIGLPSGNIQGQGSYNINIAVNPKDEKIVFLSGISLWKAIRDPNTNNWEFSNVGETIHPDNHSFAFSPDNPEIIYAGNDGGIYRSNNSGISWDDQINKGLCITQFNYMDQDAISGKIILAGTQDNGTLRYAGNPTFYHSADGDGGFACIDPNNQKNMWHTYYNLSPEFSNSGGDINSWQWIGEKIFEHPSEFYPPLTLNRNNSNDIAIGGQILYLAHSQGNDDWPERINLGLDTQTITAINYVNSDLIYVGTSDGLVFSLTKLASNWKIQRIHAAPFPTNRYLWDVQTLPNDEKKVVVPISGFGTGHVFRGDIQPNGTAQWTDISGNDDGQGRLPDNPANAIIIDDSNPNIMYVGMDVGVFGTIDGGKNWARLGKGLPNVQIYDMRLHSSTRLLTVVTHGRGMWQLRIP